MIVLKEIVRKHRKKLDYHTEVFKVYVSYNVPLQNVIYEHEPSYFPCVLEYRVMRFRRFRTCRHHQLRYSLEDFTPRLQIDLTLINCLIH